MVVPTIHITFNLEQLLRVPINYQHLLQAFVYSILPQEEASYIHDQGYQHNNRIYRPLCFSKISSPETTYDKRTRNLTFNNQIRLSISSIIPEIIEKTVNNIIISENLHIHGQRISVETVNFDKNIVTTSTLIVDAISPITVYSTFEKRNGTKITHYFTPRDKVFDHLIQENFARKYEAFTGESLENEKELLTIKPVHVNEKNKVVTNYKNIWITGWTGVYELQAKPEYLSFILNTGLSAKNASGFGMVVPAKTLPKRN